MFQRAERVFIRFYIIYGDKTFTITLYNDFMLPKTEEHHSHRDFNEFH